MTIHKACFADCQGILLSLVRPIPLWLAIYGFGEDWNYAGYVIDCSCLDARGCGNVKWLTGIDASVQRAVLANKSTPLLLARTASTIECDNLTRVGLECRGGVHRSVSLAILLMKFVYPNAVFYPSSDRVRTAAFHSVRTYTAN